MSAVRLGGALKELRIHLCQTSKQSAGVRYIRLHKSYSNLYYCCVLFCSSVNYFFLKI